MLFDGNGGLISAPTVMGSQLVVDGNRFTYSYHVTSSVIADAVQPLLGSVRSAYPNVISPYQTVVSYDSTPILGDVNRDGYADNLDSAYILRYDVGLIELDEQQFEVGDVNGDGFVDSLDAAQILKYDAGIIDQLP